MQVRLCLGWGGDGTIHGINVLNDIGSDLLTLFYAVLGTSMRDIVRRTNSAVAEPHDKVNAMTLPLHSYIGPGTRTPISSPKIDGSALVNLG